MEHSLRCPSADMIRPQISQRCSQVLVRGYDRRALRWRQGGRRSVTPKRSGKRAS